MPPRLDVLDVISTLFAGIFGSSLPSTALLVAHSGELDLYAIHAVDAVNEQDQNEDECYLVAC